MIRSQGIFISHLIFLSVSLLLTTVVLDKHASGEALINKRTFWQPSIGSNGLVFFTLRPVVNGNTNTATNTGGNTGVAAQGDEADRQAQLLLNAKRTEHGSQPLAFSAQLKALAVTCAAECQQYSLSSTTSPDAVLLSALTQTACYTQALGNDTAVYFYESSSRQPLSSYSSAVTDWYQEVDQTEQEYNFQSPVLATITEYQHLTQMLWNSTRFFGSACSPTTITPTTTTIPTPPLRFACSFAFRPGGNVRRRFGVEELDEYKKNVKPLIP